MLVKLRFVALLLSILISFLESESANVTAVITKLPSPLYAVEGENSTLEWTYTVDGSVGFAKFAIVNDDGSELAFWKRFSTGDISYKPEYQERFKVEVSDTRAELTILSVQRSDEETYKFNIDPTGDGSILEEVILVVNFSSSITNITGQNVTEGGNATLKCLAEGKPTPTITWTELSDNSTVTMPIIKVSRYDSRAFRCTADNGVGTPATQDIFIDVQYKPDTVSLVTNTTENTNCSDLLWIKLTCEASDANPPVESFQLLKEGEIVATNNYGTWIRGISEAKEHVYTCKALHLLGNVTSDSVIVTFNVPAQISVFASGSEVLIEGGSVSLHCIASAYPEPTVSWSKLNSNGFTESSSWLNFTNIGRDEGGNYICIANNTCGKRNSSTTTVDVQYPPEVNDRIHNATVAEGVEHTFSCPVGGNPVPDISWYSETGTYSGKRFRTQQSGCYICAARNIHGISDNITQCLIIDSSLPTVPPTTGLEIRAILTIITSYEQAFKNLNSASSKEFVAKFEQEMDKVYMNMLEYIRAEVTQLRPGSVIVYFILYFKTAVSPEKGIENLRIAISSNGTFGGFQVKDLVLMSEESTKSTETTGPSSSSVTASKAGPPWIIIIAVAGGVVLLAILVGVLTWRVHKQRKCRKDTKIHNSNLGRDDNERGYSEVQVAYAQSGPPAANGTDGTAGQEIEVAAAIPTYAVVDKSKKKKKLREEVPAVYAEVDKSKKKKKKVDDKNLYETLDEPKKVRKPGELLYADLGDFQNPGMSAVSISPQPLPAIKIPEPYERTDYADITQFHKGNAKLPQNDGNEDTEMKPKRPSKKKVQGNDSETRI